MRYVLADALLIRAGMIFGLVAALFLIAGGAVWWHNRKSHDPDSHFDTPQVPKTQPRPLPDTGRVEETWEGHSTATFGAVQASSAPTIPGQGLPPELADNVDPLIPPHDPFGEASGKPQQGDEW